MSIFADAGLSRDIVRVIARCKDKDKTLKALYRTITQIVHPDLGAASAEEAAKIMDAFKALYKLSGSKWEAEVEAYLVGDPTEVMSNVLELRSVRAELLRTASELRTAESTADVRVEMLRRQYSAAIASVLRLMENRPSFKPGTRIEAPVHIEYDKDCSWIPIRATVRMYMVNEDYHLRTNHATVRFEVGDRVSPSQAAIRARKAATDKWAILQAEPGRMVSDYGLVIGSTRSSVPEIEDGMTEVELLDYISRLDLIPGISVDDRVVTLTAAHGYFHIRQLPVCKIMRAAGYRGGTRKKQ